MALWTPAEITTALWLDAADADTITLNGSNVSQWDDKSGNDRHATQGGSTAQPGYSMASWEETKPALSFDGSNDTLICSGYKSVDTSQPHTYIAVIKSNTLSVMPFVIAQLYDGGSGVSRESALFGVSSSFSMTNSFAFGPRPSGLNNQARIAHSTDASVLIGVATIGNNALWRNGDINDSRATTLINNNTDDLRIGSRSGGGETFSGLIVEVIMLDFAADTDTRQKIEGYLAWKWGLAASLPAEHPYKDAAPIILIPRLFGTIADKDGNPAERRISVLDATGQCVATDTSDPVTGAYSIDMPNDDPYTLVFDGEPDRNAQVFANVIPGEPPA